MTAKNKLLLYSLFISFLILMWIPRSKASEEILVSVTTDIDKDYYHLVIDVDDEGQFLKSFYIDNFKAGKPVTRDALPMDTFIKEGISVRNGRNTFAQIIPENFDGDQGGMIIIDVLSNILTGKRKKFELQIAKDKTGWRLFNHGKAITKILARSNRIPLIGVIGAKDLIME